MDRILEKESFNMSSYGLQVKNSNKGKKKGGTQKGKELMRKKK